MWVFFALMDYMVFGSSFRFARTTVSSFIEFHSIVDGCGAKMERGMY
jgi:hypothetical protein